jgi:20S proteasome subunit beta 4
LTDRISREVLLGITGKDFTLIAASKAAMRGATILKAADDKTRQLNKHTLMAFSGEAGDTGWWPRCGSDWRIHPS